MGRGNKRREAPTKEHTSHRSKHEYQCDSPGDIGGVLAELLCERFYGQGDREEIKSVPAPREERDEEEHPLLEIQLGQQFEGIRRLAHRRLQRGQPGRQVSSHTHVLIVVKVSVGGVLFPRLGAMMPFVVVVGRHYGGCGLPLGQSIWCD